MSRFWQVWAGEAVEGLGKVAPGELLFAEVKGVGDVHFTRDPRGRTLVHGPKGLGRLFLGAGQAASADANAAYDAASAANDAIGNDSNYCTSVGTTGSAVNTAVHNFKVAWNAWAAGGDADSPAGTVPVGTWNYEAATAAAMASLLGSAPPPCGAQPNPNPNPNPQPQPQPQPTPTPSSGGGSVWPWVFGVAGVAVVGAVGYAVLKKPSSGELHAQAARHAQRATTHRMLATRVRRLAHEAKRSEARAY